MRKCRLAVAPLVPSLKVRPSGALEDVRGVPVLLRALDEEPLMVAAFVAVKITDGHHDPLAARFVFGAAVHLPGGTIVIDEIDLVAAYQMLRPVERTHARIDEPPQRFAADAMRAAVHIFHEKLHPGFQIPGIDRDRVADRELLYREMRFVAPDPRQKSRSFRHVSPRIQQCVYLNR